MPVFARRRLQAMLDDLSPAFTGTNDRQLVRRLNSKRLDQVLPAEMELALIWAMAQLGDLEVEPESQSGRKRPDAFSTALIPGKLCAIEIAAPEDNAISGEADMDQIAREIGECADQVRKGLGSYLYFTFSEESGYINGEYVRKRLAPANYSVSDRARHAIQSWAASDELNAMPLQLRDDGLAVQVERKAYKQTRFHNCHSTMPPETHSLEDNPLFELLDRKRRQLRDVESGAIRMIFLADAGSTLLRRIGRFGEADHTQRRKSGSAIIGHFLSRRRASVEAVVVFSPFKEHSPFPRLPDPLGRPPRRWNVTFFGTEQLPNPPSALEKVAAALPAPHYEGYQARSLFRQGAFSPASKGQYLGMTVRSNDGEGKFQVEFPARMLLDLLAGRLSEERFRQQLAGRSGSENLFKHWLDQGLTISGVEMLPRDPDEDDDHIVLHFTDDPGARPFRSR